MLNSADATDRWTRVQRMMAELDLDLLVAVDLTRDEIMLGHQRWLTGFIPIGGPAAVLFGRDGSVELMSERIGKPVTEYFKAQNLPIELFNGFSASILADRIARRQSSPRGDRAGRKLPVRNGSRTPWRRAPSRTGGCLQRYPETALA